jgi:hypothetical protein
VASGRWIRVRHPRRARAHSVTIRLKLRPAAGALFRMRKPVPGGSPGAEAVFGRVRSGVGHWQLVDSHGETYELRAASWRECPAGFSLVGAKFQPDGFWLCARKDLAPNRFYVGNVVNGTVGYYRVQSGKVTPVPRPPRLSCRGRSKLIGRLSTPDGFWLCMGLLRD